jgi:hypothetical protein
MCRSESSLRLPARRPRTSRCRRAAAARPVTRGSERVSPRALSLGRGRARAIRLAGDGPARPWLRAARSRPPRAACPRPGRREGREGGRSTCSPALLGSVWLGARPCDTRLIVRFPGGVSRVRSPCSWYSARPSDVPVMKAFVRISEEVLRPSMCLTACHQSPRSERPPSPRRLVVRFGLPPAMQSLDRGRRPAAPQDH